MILDELLKVINSDYKVLCIGKGIENVQKLGEKQYDMEGDFMKATKVDKDLCIGCGLCCGSATKFSV